MRSCSGDQVMQRITRALRRGENSAVAGKQKKIKQVKVFSCLGLSMKPKSYDSTHTKYCTCLLDVSLMPVSGGNSSSGQTLVQSMICVSPGLGLVLVGRADEEALAGGAGVCFKLHPSLYCLVLVPMASQMEWYLLHPSRCVPSHQADVCPADCSWGGSTSLLEKSD